MTLRMLWARAFISATIAASGGCSDTSSPADGANKEHEVCKFAGETICGFDKAGKSPAVLLCEVTVEFGRVWVLAETCPAGCLEAVCLPEPADIADGASGDLAADIPIDLPPECLEKCDGKECGPDGCGGVCALCPTDHKCGDDFKCFLHCEPQCDGKHCGGDGCGGSCGDCPFSMACVDGLCQCKPQCQGKDCGADGCGGTCGDCLEGFHCSPFGTCDEPCNPDCDGKECGPDGCGAECGVCAFGLFCSPDGLCTDQCFPKCDGKECGPDDCGGICGFCPCVDCVPEATECDKLGLCTVPDQKMGCSALIDCLNDCEGDVICQQQCSTDATPEAVQMYEDLVNCIVLECGNFPTDQCVQDAVMGACMDLYFGCVDDL